jgi:uncharacterized membrane-anchored protein
MIARRENALEYGKVFKFRTAPVDPADAFRGRYVAINVSQNGDAMTNQWMRSGVAVTNAAAFERGQRVYARLETGTNGFAHFSEPTRRRPEGQDYVQARVAWVDGNRVQLDLPFDRFYMNEKAAPAAEKAYREHSRRTNQDAYITVRVLSGFAVLEDLYVAGKPVREWILSHDERRPSK